MREEPVLITGATGYVGGRLVMQLLRAGYRLRVMGRSLEKLRCRLWGGHPDVELVEADVLDPASLLRAAKGCWAVFYLVHSMNAQKRDFVETDRRAARNMVKAATDAKMDRIVYLGGLGRDDSSLSRHLRSRTEVARILQSGPVPTTFLRAAMILGSGSASFEILRYLVERLPIMVTPRWVDTPCQPIAIRNVLNYLQGCLEQDALRGGTFDIGGPDILSYRDLMRLYAEEAGLPGRWVVPVPFLTPRLSSYWIHLVTPVPSTIARPLAEGLRTPVVCRENRIRDILPQELLPCREAIGLALEETLKQKVETCWSDAGKLEVPEWLHCGDAPYAGGTVLECGYRALVKAAPEEIWESIVSIGGNKGWYGGTFLWRIRGAIDRFLGGMGLRRGRRHPTELYVGDALDFWRVLELDKPYRLLLVAEMKLPGEATLEFTVHPLGNGRSELKQLSRFLPKGLLGILYWYALYPFHQWLFSRMMKGIARSLNRPLVQGPDRFVPRMEHVCYVNPKVRMNPKR
jgi:uncharacterized protein YbjT (DUF2867 family)